MAKKPQQSPADVAKAASKLGDLKARFLFLIGALIEARSCERFAKIAPRLPERLGKFYGGLLASEARHFEHYVAFAKSECGVDDAEIEERLDELKAIEARLIADPDPQFRFHSGTPVSS
mgnify:CR=1 FL=1